jgi:hypothetical protein
MLVYLLLALLLLALFGYLGVYVNTLFFIVLIVLLVLAFGGYSYRGRWR